MEVPHFSGKILKCSSTPGTTDSWCTPCEYLAAARFYFVLPQAPAMEDRLFLSFYKYWREKNTQINPLLICWRFVFFKGKRVIISQFQGKEMLKSKSLCSVSLFLTNPPFCYCSVLNKFLILRHIHKFAEPTNKPSHPQDWTLITFWIDLQIPVIKNHS